VSDFWLPSISTEGEPVTQRAKIEGNLVVFSDLLSEDAALSEQFAFMSARRCVEGGMAPEVAELLYGLTSGALSNENEGWAADLRIDDEG
jgi:hypothetical protein